MRASLGLAAALALVTASSAVAQTPGVERKTLQDQPFPGPNLHTVTVHVVVAPGAEVKPHTHPGLEMAYVVAGEGRLLLGGKPRTVHGGESFAVPPRTVHSVKNDGRRPLELVSTYVVEKDQPLSSPAP
jgi:quercetin dioxygenase-like cupin family protein